jgi:hypothetical protein
MNNRKAGSGKLVMFFTSDTEKKRQIEELCRRVGASTRLLKSENLNTPVGTLAGITHGDSSAKKTSGMAVSSHVPAASGVSGAPDGKAPFGATVPEMMVFCGFTSEALDEFLKAYREANIQPIALKAIVTPYNHSWNLYQLSQELFREHLQMNS